eukprot:8762793-Alexandrium_andersonii.AAC.1
MRLKRYSSTQKAVDLSSGEAELAGVAEGASEGLGVQSVAHDLGLTSQVLLRAGSAAALGVCHRSRIGKVWRLAASQLRAEE